VSNEGKSGPIVGTRIAVVGEPQATIIERPMPMRGTALPELPPDEPRSVFDPGLVSELHGVLRGPPADRLELGGTIAQGGMGTIEMAEDKLLGRRVAKKTIHRALQLEPSLLRMFLREARVNALLDHPNIVPVYDIGEDAEQTLYFTMKWVEGQPLKRMIEELPDGPWDYATLYNLLDVVIKVCDALAFAHSRGVIHCDIKPDNVMVGDYGQVYLMDWGIARVMGAATGPQVRGTIPPPFAAGGGRADATDQSVIGTASYMSPEQAQGNRAALDARADVFLLGGLLFEILGRRPPYLADSLEDTIGLALRAEYPQLTTLRPETTIPRELERITMKALSRQRSERYAGPAEIKEDLLRFIRGGAEFPQTSFKKGEYVVREGEPGDSAYIIVSGKCEVLKVIDGSASVMQKLGPGQVFGEMAVLTEGPRTATVLATEDTTALVVTRQEFDQELASMKPWMRSVTQTLASRFRDLYASNRVTHVGAPNPVRVAKQLFAHLAAWGERGPQGEAFAPWTDTCREMDAQLGAPAALAIHQVTNMYKEIKVDFTANRVTITDPAALRLALLSSR
jgi:serine/threonine protein kinase